MSAIREPQFAPLPICSTVHRRSIEGTIEFSQRSLARKIGANKIAPLDRDSISGNLNS